MGESMREETRKKKLWKARKSRWERGRKLNKIKSIDMLLRTIRGM